MKKILNWILWPLIAILSFLIGLFARQPAINKLKKQVTLLQQDNEKLLNIIETNHQSFQELLVQHKALKAIQISKKQTWQRFATFFYCQKIAQKFLHIFCNMI